MKTRFLALAALVLGLASCQNDFDGERVNGSGEVDFQLSVGAEELATRAGDKEGQPQNAFDSAYGAIDYLQATDVADAYRVDWSEVDLRYTLEVYDKATDYTNAKPIKDRQVKIVDNYTPVVFDLRLVPGREYHFVVFADFVDQGASDNPAINTQRNLGRHHVIGNTLADITIKADAINNEVTDAYFATKDITITNSAAQDIVLKRPYGKVRVVATDLAELNLNVNPAAVKVEYTAKHPQSFNALTGMVGDWSEETYSLVSEYNEIYKEADKGGLQNHFYNAGYDALEGHKYETADGKVRHTHMTLFTDYILGEQAADGTLPQTPINFTMTVYDKYVSETENSVIKTTTFNTPIPVQRNYLTTVIGNVLTTASEIEVKIDDNFSNNENITDRPHYVEIISGEKSETIELTEGVYCFDDIKINVTDGPAIIVKGDVVIDVLGVMTLDSKGGIVVEDGASLIINGLVETRAAERGGILTIETEEGSAIGGKNITIQNLAGLTAKANGKHAFGIGAEDATVVIKNTKIDYVAGGHIQPLFVSDTKYGKSEPEGGAAIGGANVTIENSEIVKAEGGSKAAAIGNKYWASTNIVIKNSTLGDIFGGNASAAIGGSRYSSDITADNKQTTKIKIENSTITNAVGGQAGAGIGSGYDTHCTANNSNAVNEIVITNSTIKAQGGKYAAGIGTGFHAAALTGSIDAASTIDATCGEDFYKDSYTKAQNIGYGIVDPAREFKGAVVTFTVAGETIAHPLYAGYEKKNDGAYFDEANNKYYITNAAGLKWVADVVNATTPYTATIFDEAVVELTNDIDLNNEEWIPIGDDRSQRTEWHGVFDGKEYTVKNVKITKKTDRDDENKSSYGLFGNVKGTVKNLTVENVSISGAPKFIGALIGRLNDGLVENCHVKSSSVECNNWTIGGLVGQLNNGKISGCSVEGTTIKGYAAVGAIAGIALNTGERTIENCSVKNCSIVKNGSFGGDFDKMFGAVLGAVYNGSLTVYINGCSVESTTVLGEASSTIFGFASEGDQVFVDGVCFTPTSVATSDALTDALANGENVVMTDDIETKAATTAPYGNKYAYKLDGGTLDGNGHELYMDGNGDYYGIMTSGGTIKNLTIQEGCRAVMIMYPQQDVILDNVKIGGDGVLYPINTGEAGADDVNLVVTNSTLAGWTSYGNIKSASFTNVQFEQGTYYNDINGRVLKPYVNTTLTDCSFIEHMNLDLSKLTDGHKVTFKNCTVNGQVITASTFTVPSTDAEYDTELFTIDLPSWASSVSDCVIFE